MKRATLVRAAIYIFAAGAPASALGSSLPEDPAPELTTRLAVDIPLVVTLGALWITANLLKAPPSANSIERDTPRDFRKGNTTAGVQALSQSPPRTP